MESNQTVTCARAGSAPVEYLQWVIAYTAVQFAFYGASPCSAPTGLHRTRPFLTPEVSRPQCGVLSNVRVLFDVGVVSHNLVAVDAME